MLRPSTLSVAALAVSISQSVVSATAGGDNSLFTKWRPRSRFLASAGWMNDPNGAMYDPTTDMYHLFYQWQPNHINPGNINMSWGHATSKDLITWTDVPHHGEPAWQNNNAEALSPGSVGSYNGLGIWSGTAQPISLDGKQDGTLLAFYTSISYMPIPQAPDGETQSVAISKDGGKSWKDYEGNPVIKSSPEGWDITGFRDPFFEAWPEMDKVLEKEEPHYYVSVGGGIKGVGARVVFYSAPSSNLTSWTFLGSLWDPKVGESFGPHSGSWGRNFEMPNFFSLKDGDGGMRFYLGLGGEGTYHSIYSEGIVTKRTNGTAAFKPVSGGVSDYGNLYTLTSFVDTKNNNRRVQWGWLAEEFPGEYARQQGFQGAFALPREIFPFVTKNLMDPDEKLKDSGAYVTQQLDGTFHASVLGVKPLEDVVKGIHQGSTSFLASRYTVNNSKFQMLQSDAGAHIELSATFPATSKGGLVVARSSGAEEYTTIYYDPSTLEVIVDRSHSTTLSNFNISPVKGYFYPYTPADNKTEDIKMRVFQDGSLLEVYVNERFALTTRIYPDRADSTGVGLYAEGKSVEFRDVQVYAGTLNVWPGRPENCSSPLFG